MQTKIKYLLDKCSKSSKDQIIQDFCQEEMGKSLLRLERQCNHTPDMGLLVKIEVLKFIFASITKTRIDSPSFNACLDSIRNKQ